MTPRNHPTTSVDGTVYVVGSLNLDTALSVRRHPAPGETVTSTTRTEGVGGKGANQAIAAARAGARVVMVGAVGNGSDGATILAGLHADDIDSRGVQRHEGPSGTAVVIVDDEGENVIVVSPGANASIAPRAIEHALGSVAAQDTVVLQNEVPREVSALAARIGNAVGATVIWNAAPAPATRSEIPEPIDILVVNEGELDAIARVVDADGADLVATLDAVGETFGVDVVCTLGAAGVVARMGGEIHRAAAPDVTAVDTTAAGDTFVGYFAAAAHLPVPERLRSAAAAGAAAVTRAGAAASIPHRAAVAALLTA